MKTNTRNILIFSIAFILIIALGVIYNKGIDREQDRLHGMISLVTDLGVDYLQEDTEFTGLVEEDTTVIAKHNGYNKNDELKAIIYIGETKGYQDGLQVAYAIDVETDSIVGFRIVNSNETDAYLNQLVYSDDFNSQFDNKDLSNVEFDVNPISGATPNGSSNTTISPYTTEGFNKIMQLVRLQYAEDTDFEAPAQITFVSYQQDFDTLNILYTLDAYGENIVVEVTKDYQFVTITEGYEDQQQEAMNIINENKMTAYINEIVTEGNTTTVTIKSKGYNRNVLLTSTAVVTDGNITSFTTNLSNESYDDDHNYDYTGGSFDPVFDAVENNTEISIVSGATITTNGIIAARDILYLYLEGVNNNA